MSHQIKQLKVTEVTDNKVISEKYILLDVREPWEIDIASVSGSINIPMHLVPLRLDELPKTADIVVMCHHGGRSQQVAQFLVHHGFNNVSNLTGGIHAWSSEIDTSIPQY